MRDGFIVKKRSSCKVRKSPPPEQSRPDRGRRDWNNKHNGKDISNTTHSEGVRDSLPISTESKCEDNRMSIRVTKPFGYTRPQPITRLRFIFDDLRVSPLLVCPLFRFLFFNILCPIESVCSSFSLFLVLVK